MTPWTDTKYMNDSLNRDEQIPHNFPRTLNICRFPKIKIKQAYLSWLEMDRNIEQYKCLLDGKYNAKEPCYCNTPNIY